MAPPAPLPDPPRGYDPAPSRNAFLTVMGVFAFFGVCFLVVALWIRCVAGVESHYERRRRGSRSSGGGGPRFGPRRLSRSGSSSRKRRGFQGNPRLLRPPSLFPARSNGGRQNGTTGVATAQSLPPLPPPLHPYYHNYHPHQPPKPRQHPIVGHSQQQQPQRRRHASCPPAPRATDC